MVGIVAAVQVTGHGGVLTETLPPPDLPLVVILSGWVVLSAGGLGIRGITSLLGADVQSGLDNLTEFGLQLPAVALAIALGLIATDHWRRGIG